MANNPDDITPEDFPVYTEKRELKTRTGEPVGVGKTERLAEQIANRLNEQAYREEEDRWSA